jgi:hypothetical protein
VRERLPAAFASLSAPLAPIGGLRLFDVAPGGGDLFSTGHDLSSLRKLMQDSYLRPE